jgi:hypothetical protein
VVARPGVGREGRRLGAAARCLVLVLALGAMQAGAAVAAEPTAMPGATEKAREHFRRGQAAYDGGRFGDAYREFEDGYRLSGRPLFLLNMGHARRRAGDPVAARALYLRFLELQPDSPHRAQVEALLREMSAPLAAAPIAPPPAPRAPAPSSPPSAVARPPSTPSPALAPVPPAAIDVRAEVTSPPPVPGRWWVWVAAGTAVAAAVTVGLIARGGGPSYTRQGSLGTLGAP